MLGSQESTLPQSYPNLGPFTTHFLSFYLGAPISATGEHLLGEKNNTVLGPPAIND